MISGTGKNVLYYNIKIDRRSPAQIQALIAQLDTIIDELFTKALASVGTGNIAEYELDTGQTKTKIRYTSTKSVTESIQSFEALRETYLSILENKCFGRVTQLVDQRNFRTR